MYIGAKWDNLGIFRVACGFPLLEPWFNLTRSVQWFPMLIKLYDSNFAILVLKIASPPSFKSASVTGTSGETSTISIIPFPFISTRCCSELRYCTLEVFLLKYRICKQPYHGQTSPQPNCCAFCISYCEQDGTRSLQLGQNAIRIRQVAAVSG